MSRKTLALLADAPFEFGADASQIPDRPSDARVRTTFEGALSESARTTLEREPALDLVARVIADIESVERQRPSQALIEWLFWRAGATSRYARVETMIAEDVDDLDLQTVDCATRVQASAIPESYGLARSSRGRAAQAIVFGRRALDVAPFPKTFGAGEPIKLKVRPLDAFSELTFVADAEDGGVVRESLAAAADGTYTITKNAPTKPGRYFIEVTGLDPRTVAAVPENPWRRTLFLAPVYVGVPEATVPDEFIRVPEASRADPATWAARIVEAYSEARVQAGKTRASTDGRLSMLAKERSGLWARSEREPPPDATLADKLAAAGQPPHDYDEHAGRIDSVTDHVRLRLMVPSTRQLILGAEPLFVAVGLTPNQPRAGGARGPVDFTVLEDLVEPMPKLDPAADRAKVYAALDAYAASEGRRPYLHDEEVAKAVQAFADEVCSGQKRANQVKTLIDKARGVGDKYRQWTQPVWRIGYDFKRWQTTSVLAKAQEPPLAFAEVGLCQGDLPGKAAGAYVVVIQFEL